jgi:hypothetical protein
MKILLFFLLAPVVVHAQEFNRYLSMADSMYKLKEFRGSGVLYNRAFKIKEGNSQDYYNAACSWSMAGDRQKAFFYLTKATQKNYLDAEWIQKDSDLQSLHQFKQWTAIIGEITQNIQKLKNRSLTKTERKEVLQNAANDIRKYHYSAQAGNEIADKLVQEFEKGSFDTATTNKSFFWEVTRYLRKISNDWHFYIGLDNSFWNNPMYAGGNASDASDKDINYGFAEVKIYPGNIGYLKWNNCITGETAFAKAAAIMTFLSDCKAIIVDITENGGGDGGMGRFLGAYFLGYDKPLTQGECRDAKKNEIERTAAHVPGKLLLDIPLFILISANTGSAAEYFAHYMKEEKRAVVMGQKSAGGAHPAIQVSLPYKTFLQVPVCVLWSYSTHKDFEGIGVMPDYPLSEPIKINESLNIIRTQLK